MSEIRNREFRPHILHNITGKCATQIKKKKLSRLHLRSSSLWTCLHHMVILRSQNKNTDFLRILA